MSGQATAPAAGAEFREDARARRLPAEVVRRLSRIDDARAALAVIVTFATIATAIGMAVLWWQPLVVAVAVLLIATRQQALFVLAHDAAHYRLFRRRWPNETVGRACGAAVGISMPTYRVVHRLHHNHLYGTLDPDVPLHGGYPRGRLYLLRKLAKDAAGLTAWKTYAYFFGAPALNTDTGHSLRPLDDTAPALRRDARRDRWLVAGLHLAAPAIALSAGVAAEYLVLWLLPLLTVLQAILRLRAVAEHGAVVDLTSPLTAARTNLGPAWLMWAIFPHHVNYHVEHHMYPAIPHYNLAACHRELARRGLLRGAEVRRFADTLSRIFAAPAPRPLSA